MKTYKAIATVGVNAGALLGLSKEQAAARTFALRKTDKKGIFEVTQRVEFKAGEVFGLDGDLPKSMAEDVEEDGKKAPTPTPTPTPTAPPAA